MNILSEEFWINNYNIKSIHNLKRLLNFYKSCNYDHSIFGYTERHHMVPLSIIPKDAHISDEINLIILSAREHFIAHLILSKVFCDRTIEKRNMVFALHMMTRNNNKMNRNIVSSRDYNYIREQMSIVMKENPINKSGIKNSFYGKHHNEESKRKISEARKRSNHDYKGENNPMYGKHMSRESKERLSNSLKGNKNGCGNKGNKLSETAKRNISQAKMGENNPAYGKYFVTDGTNNLLISKNEDIPQGYRKGMTRRNKK